MAEPATEESRARRTAIERYLCAGEYEPSFPAWSGNVIERETQGTDYMLKALVAEVNKLSAGHDLSPALLPADLAAFTRKKVEPMVRGLFRQDEQEAVLAVLEKSVAFLAPGNIEDGHRVCCPERVEGHPGQVRRLAEPEEL